MSRHELLLYSPAIKVGDIMTQHFEESFPHLHFRIKFKTKKDLKFDVFLDAAIYLAERGEYFLKEKKYLDYYKKFLYAGNKFNLTLSLLFLNKKEENTDSRPFETYIPFASTLNLEDSNVGSITLEKISKDRRKLIFSISIPSLNFYLLRVAFFNNFLKVLIYLPDELLEFLDTDKTSLRFNDDDFEEYMKTYLEHFSFNKELNKVIKIFKDTNDRWIPNFLNKENYRTFLLSSLRNLFSYVALNHFKKRDLMERDDLTYLFTKKENSLQFRIDMIDLSNYKEIAFEDFL